VIDKSKIVARNVLSELNLVKFNILCNPKDINLLL